MGLRSGQVSWLPGLPLRAFPARRRRSSGSSAAALVRMASPGHSGGSAPDSHRLPLTTDPERDDGTLAPPVTVNLTRIYTKLGDSGETHLGDMSRVPKTHPRIEAYGVVDELNANIGLALTVEGLPERYGDWLRRIQNDLFDVGADLSVPPGGERQRLRVAPEQVTWLEEACDEVNAELPALRSFVLPGGTRAAAQLHVCRTVCRRAERRALDVEDGNPEVVRYLNRLSDLLFILSRGANAGEEPLWEPGRYR
jgi:cob(I)alamin adenosyltransferase